MKIGITFSEYDHVTSGVPQGSCAGPILFILFVNDLPDCNFYRNTVVSLFADDTKISTTFSSIAERPSMQINLNVFINWATKWQLQIADHKCCVLSHGKVIPPVYHINGIQLSNVNEFRDLGVIVDSHCIFKQHILQICRKAYVSINVIFRCFHSANVHALLTAYRSFVRPTLEYCSTVWNPALSARHYLGLTDALERVQRYFTRRVYYLYYNSPYFCLSVLLIWGLYRPSSEPIALRNVLKCPTQHTLQTIRFWHFSSAALIVKKLKNAVLRQFAFSR